MSKRKSGGVTKTTHDHYPYNSMEEQLKVEVDSFDLMRKLHFPKPLVKWRNLAEEAHELALNGGSVTTHFDFSAPLPRAKDEVVHHIALGVDLNPGKGQITYSFSIGHQPEDRLKIIRRVHFDIETDRSTEPKPMSHLQLYGGFAPGLTQYGYQEDDYKTDLTAIEKPRIPCQPMTFALMAHWALLEYQSTEPEIQEFAHRSDWVRCVINAEHAVLGKYFSHVTQNMETWKQNGKSYLSGCYR